MTTSMSATRELITERLTLRPWRLDDADAALEIYGPSMADLAQWIVADGRWAIQRNTDGRVIGGAVLLPLPPGLDDLELGWQLHPATWGQGYARETAHALATWAFSQDVDEVFAVVRPGDDHAAATARHAGMQWVGETAKYFGTTLQVFRLRSVDLTY
jgi:RimJ/RimL family protein N-acetyltransferase